MTWFTLIIISTISFSFTSILQRVLLKEDQSEPVIYGFVFQFLVGLLILAYTIFFHGFALPQLVNFVPNLILMSFLYAFANLTLFKAFQTTEASEIAVIMASRSIWTVLTAVLFLHEIITGQRLVGVLLIVLGVVVISFKKGKWQLNKGHLLALLSAVFLGSAFTNDAFLLQTFDAFSYNSIAFFLPSLTLISFKPKSILKIKLFLNKKRLMKMLIASFFYGIAAVTIGLAYQAGGNASQIAPISQLSIVLTVVLAFIFLKERKNLLPKILGALLVFSGVILLK